jgi:hypothetical protein
MTVPTLDWLTLALTGLFTVGALVGVGYSWRGRILAQGDLDALLEEDINGGDKLVALRNLRAKKKRLWMYAFLAVVGCLSFLTPVRADAAAAVVILGYVELPARFLRDAFSVGFIVWEVSMLRDDQDDNETRTHLARAVAEEKQRKDLAQATGGRVGGLRADDPPAVVP